MATVEVLTSQDWPVRLKSDWSELLAAAAFPTPFQSLDWLETWSEHFGRHRSPFVITAREGKDLIGVMPLMVCEGAWRTLRTLGLGTSDYLHAIARPGYEVGFAGLVAGAIEGSSAHLLDLHQIPSGEPMLTSIQEAEATKQATCLFLSLPSTFDEYLKRLSKSMRYEARRLDKPPYSVGDAKIRWPSDPDEVKIGLDVFFDLHARRWKKRGLPGAFALSRIRSFHYRFAIRAAKSGMLRLGVLEHRSKPIGVIYGLALHGTWFFYQSGFDPSQRSLSPGNVLVAASIRKAIEEGAQAFDFLRGDEPYKRRWAPDGIRTNYRLLKTLRVPLGKVGQAWNSVGGRIESKVRARLEGRGLIQ